MNFDAIIIGGGLGGLTAGATLSRFGKKVLLLEQHYIPGGCASTFKRKDFVMEVGLHEMDGLHKYDTKRSIFDFLGVWKNISIQQVPELYRIKGGNYDLVVPHGKKELLEQLSEQYPYDREGIHQLLELMEGVLREIPKLSAAGWEAKLARPDFPERYPNVAEASKYTLGEWLDKFIKSEELKIILQGNILYYGDDPYDLSLVYFSAAQTSYIGGGGHYIKGGSLQLSNYLANEIKRLGGQVLLGKQVTNILTEDGKAVGLRYEDAFNSAIPPREEFAPIVIANAAIPLVKKMLPTTEANQLGEHIDGLAESCSLISIYLGFSENLKQLGVQHYTTFLFSDAVKTLSDVGKVNKSTNWEEKPFSFIDYSQIDAGLCPEDKTFGVICAVDYLSTWKDLSPDEYKAEKKRVANIFLDRLEKGIPGITQYIEHVEVGTPKTIQSYTRNPKGTPYGFAQSLTQTGRYRLHAKSPIENLYFASAWATPGGGFTGAIISGFLCALQAKGKLKRSGKEVQKIPDNRIVNLIERKIIAENTFELVIEKPADLAFEAGQYAVLTINDPSFTELDMPLRPLTIASHPDEPHLRFAMRQSDSSFKKSCMAMEAGASFTVYAPLGDFTIQPSNRSKVFLIAGIGITPVLPLLEELQKDQFDGAIHLFYCNRTEAQAAYHEDFKKMETANFHYHPTFTATSGRINLEKLAVLDDLTQYDYYIVGTTSFLESMETILAEKEVPRSQIFIDDFG